MQKDFFFYCIETEETRLASVFLSSLAGERFQKDIP
jgi:hypothetical protein